MVLKLFSALNNNYFLISLIITLYAICLIPLIGKVVDLINHLLLSVFSLLLPAKTAYFIFNKLTFPGVILHELSHALFCLVSGAKITDIRLFKPEGNNLGYVRYKTRGNFLFRAFQQAFSSCAPVIIGVICLALLIKVKSYFVSFFLIIIWGYLFFSIFVHSRMSDSDIKCYIKGILFVAPTIYLGVILWLI